VLQLRPLLIGLFAAVTLFVVVMSGGLPEPVELALVVLVPLLPLVVALLTPQAEGWPRRLLRGLLGGAAAAGAGAALIVAFPELFPVPDEHGADLFFALLLGLAAASGGAAAAARTRAYGFSLACGFSLGVGVPFALSGGVGPALILLSAPLVGAAAPRGR
jgi:hypothetical protein